MRNSKIVRGKMVGRVEYEEDIGVEDQVVDVEIEPEEVITLRCGRLHIVTIGVHILTMEMEIRGGDN